MNIKKYSKRVHTCFSFNYCIDLLRSQLTPKKLIKYKGLSYITFSDKILPQGTTKFIDRIMYRAFASYFVEVAIRYKKKYSSIIYAWKEYYTIPYKENVEFNARLLCSIIDFSSSKDNNEIKSSELFCQSTGNKIVDELIKRKALREKNIKITFQQFAINFPRDKRMCYYRQNIYWIKCLGRLRDIISFPKIFSSLPTPNHIALITHPRNSNYEAYQYLPTQISNEYNTFYYSHKNISKYGANNFGNIKTSIKRAFDVILASVLTRNKHPILLSDFFVSLISELYILSVRRTIKKYRVKGLFVSYHCRHLEKLLFLAFRKEAVVSIFCDYSFGYPWKQSSILKWHSDCTQYPDYILSSGLIPSERYRRAAKRERGGLIPVNISTTCPQVNHSLNKQKKSIQHVKSIKSSLSNPLVISIFDNNYGEDMFCIEEHAMQLLNIIDSYSSTSLIISNTKRHSSTLDTLIREFDLNVLNTMHGDLSLNACSDIIISIGFQGSALKASAAFNIPIIFLVDGSFNYQECNFSFSQIKNDDISFTLDQLCLTPSQISNLLQQLKNNTNSLENFALASEKLINLFQLKPHDFNLLDKITNIMKIRK